MIIKTNSGEIKGLYQDQLYQFRGIPYAFAKRFQKPTITHWQECLDCTFYRDKAPQNETNNPNYIHQSEDCLNLNIYTPTLNKSLPVLVEFHGGAFQEGSNQGMDPVGIIGDDEFIYVNINYRLGVLGYLYLEDELGAAYRSSGNNGLLDQIAALKWIYDNIQYFGGDNQRITLLGSSAGAKSVASLLAVPEAKKYFHQVILMSGAYQSIRDSHTAQMITDKFKAIVQLEDFKDIVNVPVIKLLQAQRELCNSFASLCYFGPVIDNEVIFPQYLEEITNNDWHGNAIIGSSLHEIMPSLIPNFEAQALEITKLLFGKNSQIVIDDFNQLSKIMKASEAWDKLYSDYMYRTYSYRMAWMLSNNNQVYHYTSAFAPAIHCLDFSLAFNPLKKYPDNINLDEGLKLGKDIRANFVHFVVHGNPKNKEWLPLSIKHTQMIWDINRQIKTFRLDDVCQNLPEQVFIL